MEIDTRFQEIQKLDFINLGDSSKFDTFSKEFPNDALENFKTLYGMRFDIDIARLKNELHFIYSDSRYKNQSLETIDHLLNGNDMKDVFKTAYLLFSLILTIPSTSCSAERSFSALKRIKK